MLTLLTEAEVERSYRKLFKDQEITVTMTTEGVDGNVHVDAVRLIEVK